MEFNDLRAAKYKDQGNTGGWTPEDVINHAFGSLPDWQFPRGWYRLGVTGDVINHAFGSLRGHSSLGDGIDWGSQET